MATALPIVGHLRRWPGPAVAALAVTLLLSSRGLATAPTVALPFTAPPAASCAYSGPTPLAVPLAGTMGGILIDPNCQYVYISNTTQNRIEVFSLQTQSLEAPIQVGTSPRGMDITPDGQTMYVANSGEATVSVVNLAQRIEARKIAVPSDASHHDKPSSIAIANNGLALISTLGDTQFGFIHQLVLSTDAVSIRADSNSPNGATFERRLFASLDRSTIAIVERSTPSRLYRSATNTFTAKKTVASASALDASLDKTGARILLTKGLFLLDSAMNMTGVIDLLPTYGGSAQHPTLPLGYRALDTNVEILNLSTFLKIGERPLGASTSNAGLFIGNYIGRMDGSDDGTMLAVITNTGFSIVVPFAFAPEKVNLLLNGTFAGALTGWQTTATPDPGYIDATVSGGVLQFNRLPAQAGPETQAAVFQNTGQPLPPGAPIDIRLGLGNSGSVARTVRVVAASSDATDPRTCTFVVPAQTALSTYRMRANTAQAWPNATISVYADTAAGDGGYSLVDNVSMTYDSTLADPESCVPPAAPPPAGDCSLNQTAPYPVAVSGTTSAILIDDACRYVYLLNKTQNRVDVFSLQTLSFDTPIQVGAMPSGFDVTADGKTMYVANGGGSNLSVVDLDQRVEVRKITIVPPVVNGSTLNAVVNSVALANNGRALVAVNTWNSTGPDELHELVLATDQITKRTDVPSNPAIDRVHASSDRSIIGVLGTGISNGPLMIYRAATNALTASVSTGVTAWDFSINADGSRLFLATGSNVEVVTNSTPAVLGTFNVLPLNGTWGGIAVHPTLGLAYRAAGTSLDVLNLATFTKVDSLPLGGTANTAQQANSAGTTDFSPNGRLLAVRTTTGFSLVQPLALGPPQNFNLVQNGTFGSDAAGWTTFATPNPSYIQGGVTGGVFEFNRLPPPPGESNQAVVFQNTGMPLPSGAPIQAQFDLGNSSTVRKRISVLLLDSDFSDLSVCTFWIPANSALAPYRMRSHTTRGWSNASIYFYAATEGADGGFNRIDNVSVQFDTNVPADRTECDDPTAPTGPGGNAGPDLLVNGDFNTGSLAPWSVFGTLTSQIAAGVFEFIRPTSTPPAGVVLQATGQPAAANEILTATFDLGNSSAARKRVTVLLHDLAFGDLSACTFWLAPGQALSPYSMSAFATQAWGNITLSLYAATVDTDPWVQFDNATLRRTPGATISGTDCVEPGLGGAAAGAAVWASTAAAARTGPASPSAAASALASASRARPSPARAAGGLGDAVVDLPGAEASVWLDLTNASRASLLFETWLTSANDAGDIQISADGRAWRSLGLVVPQEFWRAIELNLDAWIGQRVAIRFVLRPSGQADQGPWLFRGFLLDIERR